MTSLSTAEENYLKAIYHLAGDNNEHVTTNGLSDYVKTKPATVSDMLKKLSKKKMINYQKYKGFHLSEYGISAALKTIRKQRLWEVFLVEKLDFHWDEVHEVAEQLEHVKSPMLVDRLDDFLKQPRVDPHGDPIPDKHGEFHIGPQVCLGIMKAGEIGVISNVVGDDPKLLKYLDRLKVRLGLKIKIKEKVDFDESMILDTEDHKELYFSKRTAQHLMITKFD